MNELCLSGYDILPITDQRSIDLAYDICAGNPLYYHYCPPFVTKDSLWETIDYLPPNKGLEDKQFFLVMEGKEPIAVIDLVFAYPTVKIVWLGLFMLSAARQGKGLGSQLIAELCYNLKQKGYQEVRLGWVKGNSQAEQFWLKNDFELIEEKESLEGHPVLVAKRML
ncbi:GNAT family N-acetyltransferase [Streptococcus rifensis]